jgi:hypothetical protein
LITCANIGGTVVGDTVVNDAVVSDVVIHHNVEGYIVPIQSNFLEFAFPVWNRQANLAQ